MQDLRYGENPHQQAAFYRDATPAPGTLASYRQLQGKELSYNNIADADAAWECVKSFAEPACVIVKHANPCGVAIAATAARGLPRGLRDRSRPRPSAASSPSTARSMRDGAEARDQAVRRGADRAGVTARRRSRGSPRRPTCACSTVPRAARASAPIVRLQARRRRPAGADAPTRYDVSAARPHGRDAQGARPTAQLHDLLFAWRVAKFVKSNAIVFCARRHDARRRRRPDEPRRLDAHRRDQGRRTPGSRSPARWSPPTPSSRSATASTSWPTPARLRDPAGRQHARRRGDRRRRRARHRDGVHGRAPLPALIFDRSNPTAGSIF